MIESFHYTVEDGLARLTLNRPERLNAFDEHLARAWADAAVDATGRDDVHAILLDAEGAAFCAGGDVTAMATSARPGFLEELASVINSGILALVESAIPVAVAAQGTTAGGGLGILLAGDYAVVGSDSRIGSRYASMGLTPDLSVTAQLSRAVGERRALQLVLQERLLSAEEAHQWGLVAEVVDAAEVRSRAEAVARGWISGAAGAYGQAKRLIRASSSRTFAAQLADEAATIDLASQTEDARDRITAFSAASAKRRNTSEEGS